MTVEPFGAVASVGQSYQSAVTDTHVFDATEYVVSGLQGVIRKHTAWVTLPPSSAVATPALVTQLRQVRELTGWSSRDLAAVLHVSHTTVRRLESEGRVSPRSREAAARVAPLYSVLSRLNRAAHDSAGSSLDALLRTSTDRGTALEWLSAGNWSRALAVGLAALNGPRLEILAPATDWPILEGATRDIWR